MKPTSEQLADVLITAMLDHPKPPAVVMVCPRLGCPHKVVALTGERAMEAWHDHYLAVHLRETR